MIKSYSYFRALVVTMLFALASLSASAQYDVYGAFASGNWWQEIGYAGVGNSNEVLAVAEADLTTTVPASEYVNTTYNRPNPQSSVVGVNSTALNVSYRLLGKATDPKYVKAIKLWARKYDATYATNNASRVSNTFAYPFDYRNPSGNSDAILLAEKTDLAASGTFTANITLDDARYVFYITADISDELDINSTDDIPFLTSINKAELGASITSISVTQNVTYTFSYLDGRRYTINGRAEYTSTINPTLSRKGRNGTNGSRVLVPARKTLYAPNDFYSKYYRIPAIAKAADGSLVAISDARKYHIHDVRNDIDILARRSTDGGKTWSNLVTIAKGEGMTSESSSCTAETTKGYGDAAIAALPNGDLLVTMIYGYGFSENASTVSSRPTQNFYCVSHDNGQSWSALKEIPSSLTTSKSSGQNDRGCIAPGNMLVVKSGALAGKVLACFRTVASSHGNFFLLYDPETGEWSRIDCTSANGATGIFWAWGNNNGTDDEAHLVEVGENKFLMSIRSSNSNGREFATLTYSDGQLSATINTFGGMTTNPTNGDIISYDAMINGEKNTYLINTIPQRRTTDQASVSSNVRSGLHAFYTDNFNGVSWLGNNITWNAGTCLSDPYDDDTYRKETAQYSSLTVLNDGTLGVLFEEYPQVVRINNDNGDYLMSSVYMQLRIGDLIPDTKPVDKEKLIAPVITPTSTTYDCNNANDRPNPIVISHENTVDGVNTMYKIYVYDKDDKPLGTIGGNFAGNSISIDWATLALEDGTTLESLVNGTDNSGVHIRVHAVCVKEGYDDSDIAVQMYVFKTPVRHIMIVAREAHDWGDPYLQSEYIGTVEQGDVMTVGTGSLVIANAADKYPYEFVGFSLDATTYTPLTAAQRSAMGVQDITPHQINFTVPTVQAIPNNDGDNLVIVAWYESNKMGVKTRVYTNYFDSNADNEDASQTHTYVRHYFHNDWYPTEVHAGDEFPAAEPGLTFDDVRTKGNNFATTNLEYNVENYALGLDVRAVVMPDSRAMGYNAIVLVKNVGTDSYVAKAPGRAPASNSSKYYLLQGTKAPFAASSGVATNATQVLPWYTTNASSQMMPVMVDNIKFDQIVAKGQKGTQPDFDVEIYVIKGNSLNSVADLVNEANYETKIVHRIRYNDNVVTDVNDLSAARQVRRVRYYNPGGMVSKTPFQGINIVVTDYTDGTTRTTKVVK